jgi:hypothetical protein
LERIIHLDPTSLSYPMRYVHHYVGLRFVNGALAVPDAPANTDTVPAKFSQKNAADDELITIAYTFKTLGDDERRAIYEALKGQQAGSAFNADIGTELPPGIELRPVPDDLAALRGDARSRATGRHEPRRGRRLRRHQRAGEPRPPRALRQNFGSSDPLPLERVLSDLS